MRINIKSHILLIAEISALIYFVITSVSITFNILRFKFYGIEFLDVATNSDLLTSGIPIFMQIVAILFVAALSSLFIVYLFTLLHSSRINYIKRVLNSRLRCVLFLSIIYIVTIVFATEFFIVSGSSDNTLDLRVTAYFTITPMIIISISILAISVLKIFHRKSVFLLFLYVVIGLSLIIELTVLQFIDINNADSRKMNKLHALSAVGRCDDISEVYWVGSQSIIVKCLFYFVAIPREGAILGTSDALHIVEQHRDYKRFRPIPSEFGWYKLGADSDMRSLKSNDYLSKGDYYIQKSTVILKDGFAQAWVAKSSQSREKNNFVQLRDVYVNCSFGFRLVSVSKYVVVNEIGTIIDLSEPIDIFRIPEQSIDDVKESIDKFAGSYFDRAKVGSFICGITRSSGKRVQTLPFSLNYSIYTNSDYIYDE